MQHLFGVLLTCKKMLSWLCVAQGIFKLFDLMAEHVVTTFLFYLQLQQFSV